MWYIGGMCQQCWNEYGSPRIDTPAVRKAAELIARVYEFNAVGGGLHVVVDDFNIEDGDLKERYSWDEETPEQVAVENECLAALRALSLEERASALALYDKLWTAPTQLQLR